MIKYAVKLKNGNYLDDNNLKDIQNGCFLNNIMEVLRAKQT